MKKLKYPPPLNLERALRLIDAFLHKKLKEAGVAKLVVGLSGGLDSAVSAALALRALGRDKLIAVKMPYKTSNPDSERHADLFIKKFGIESLRFDITPVVDGYFGLEGALQNRAGLEPAPAKYSATVRKGNFMARTRMAILFDISAKYGALVLGTGNKSEILLGYTTWYGDSACALNPIGDIYKTQLFEPARYLQIPDEITKKAPSADLWPDQTDEKDMGILYSEADAVLYLVFDEKRSEKEAGRISKVPPERVKKIVERARKMEFKHKLPPIARMR